DRRAPTPTAAASLAVPDRAEWLERLRHTYQRMKQLTLDHLLWEWERLQKLKQHRFFARPEQILEDRGLELDEWNERLVQTMKRYLQSAQKELSHQAAMLSS
ncbi:MAG TPA: exodeoxyribonuclease VII large subunit, partial [Gemmatales bacterium]|nr:exodeoxyribonuclease VII large subunit [Gemmatales bacterium]